MQSTYHTFIDQLKTIKKMSNDDIFYDKQINNSSLSSMLGNITYLKRTEALLIYVKAIFDDIESKIALNETKGGADLTKSLKDFQSKFNQEKNTLEEEIKDNPLLEKAYSKIKYKLNLDDFDFEKLDIDFEKDESIAILKSTLEEKLTLDIDPESTGLIAYIFTEFEKDPTYEHFRHERHKLNMMYQSSIVILCTYLETFFSSLIKDFHLNMYGGDLVKKNTISFKELKEINDVEAARVFLIESELDSLFRENFREWFDYIDGFLDIESNFKKNIINDLLDEIAELYLRRNLYVHADGVVSEFYMKNAPKKYTYKLAIGDNLPLDKKYIDHKLYIVEKIGTMAFYSYSLKKHRKDLEGMFFNVNELFLKLITDSDNDIYSCIFNKFANNSKLKSASRLIAKMNYFLCFKLRGEYSRIEQEINKFDDSGLSDDFKRAKKIIMEDEDGLFEVIDHFETLDDNLFLRQIQWPLYSIIEEESIFVEYVNDRLNRIFS